MKQASSNLVDGLLLVFVFLVILVQCDPGAIARADEIKTFTWTVPTERTDNTPLPAVDLKQYELGCAATPTADPAVYSAWPVTDPTIATRLETFPPGRWYCVLRVYAVGTDGDLASAWSNQVFFSILIAPPNPPGALSVN